MNTGRSDTEINIKINIEERIKATGSSTNAVDINAHWETPVPRLGLVCITTTDAIRFRTITRTRLLQFPESERPALLRDIYEDNLLRLDRAIAYCRAHNIGMYRISSNLLPFADDPAYQDVLNRCAWLLHQAGESAHRLNVRLLSHPEQFVVLSSDSANVVANSIRTLQMHAHILDMLGQPRSLACPMEIHGGKSNRADALVRTIETLGAPIRSRLILENDEDAYSSGEILAVCRRAGVPMVFDAHHHVCHEKLGSYEDGSVQEMFWAARETWPDPAWQLTHISNGRAFFADTRHSDLVTQMPSVYRCAPWIEVEAKSKEQAIALLQSRWLDSLPAPVQN